LVHTELLKFYFRLFCIQVAVLFYMTYYIFFRITLWGYQANLITLHLETKVLDFGVKI